MMKMISEECVALALYGIDSPNGRVAGFYEMVLQWFQDLGYPADKLGVTGPGHSGKIVSFSRGDTKLKKTGFDSLTGLEVYSLVPDAQIPVNDYLLTASWSRYSYVCIVSRVSIMPLSRSALLPFAEKLIREMKPAYGIGYKRDNRRGPAMYAVGIGQGLGPGGYGVGLKQAEREEADSISRWCNGMRGRVWRKGILRDVYPWNFLTEPQLTKQVCGISLEQWVRQDAKRGTVSPLWGGVSLWEVDEANLSVVRQALNQASVIFDWKKHSELC